jgi:maltose O-acetyltransferase
VSDDVPRKRPFDVLAETLADPRKTRDVVVAIARARLLFRRCERGRRVRAFGDVRVVADGRIALGDLVFFRDGIIASELVCHEGAEIVIGARTGFSYGVSIEARQRVVIGDACLFGAMVRVGDASGDRVAPITIGDDVWIAHGAFISPGVTIGSGSVVSAGSVVTSDVPPQRMAIGNPARAVRLDLRKGP